MKTLLAALALCASAAFAQGIDAEFEQYKTPDGINRHFYRGRIDSNFFRQRAGFEWDCSVREYTSWGSLVYYLFPVESLVLTWALRPKESFSAEGGAFLFASMTFFYVLPTAGHLYFLSGTQGLKGLYREHLKQAPMETNGRFLYFTGLTLRYLVPLAIYYASQLDFDYGDFAPILIYPLLWTGPALQWHGLQKVDDERLFASGGLDEVKLSPALGMRVDPRSGEPALFGGMRLAF